MKKILILFFAIISVNSLAQSVIIDGYINNAQGNPVNLSIDRTYLGVHPEVFTAKTSEGSFSFTLNEAKEFIATLSYGTESYLLFLAPDETLHVAFTADLLSATIQLSGNAAPANLFLKSFNKKFASDYTDSLMDNKMLAMGVDAFEIDIFNSRKKQLEYFKADSSYNKFSPAFKNYFTNLVNYRYWNLLLAYPIVKANSNAKILHVDELPPPLLEGFEKVKVSNADALICDSYRSFLKYYVIYFTSKENGFNKFTDYNSSMERKNLIAQKALSDSPYQYWLSRFLLDEYEKAQPSTVKRLYLSLILSDKQSVYASIVKEKCGEYMEKKDEVKTSKNTSGNLTANDNCKIVTDKGKPVKFSDFKGKVIYVDFWASWCGPCRQEMPHSKELHHKFTEKQLKNIVFLYISTDRGEAAWRKAVVEIGVEGIQAWSSPDWPDCAGNLFSVTTIPHYVLFDKNGQVVDDNAKRPSDPEIYGDILYLLK